MSLQRIQLHLRHLACCMKYFLLRLLPLQGQNINVQCTYYIMLAIDSIPVSCHPIACYIAQALIWPTLLLNLLSSEFTFLILFANRKLNIQCDLQSMQRVFFQACQETYNSKSNNKVKKVRTFQLASVYLSSSCIYCISKFVETKLFCRTV